MAAVDVWSVDLVAARGALRRYLPDLSEEERERARRFATPEGLLGFAVTRAVLRRLLAGRLGAAPRELRFETGPYDKPFIPGAHELAFNVSHTRGCALVAIGEHGPVGVDVERVDPALDVAALAERCFSVVEREALRRLRPPARLRAFFDVWTRKEAFVKALGAGLSHDLASFSVSIGEPAALLGRESADWRLAGLEMGPDYAAALVVRAGGGPIQVRRYAWADALCQEAR